MARLSEMGLQWVINAHLRQGVTQTLRHVGGGLPPGTLGALRDSLLSGISSALSIGGCVVLAGAVVAWALLRSAPAADTPAARVLVTAGAHPAEQRLRVHSYLG